MCPPLIRADARRQWAHGVGIWGGHMGRINGRAPHSGEVWAVVDATHNRILAAPQAQEGLCGPSASDGVGQKPSQKALPVPVPVPEIRPVPRQPRDRDHIYTPGPLVVSVCRQAKWDIRSDLLGHTSRP